MENKEPSKLEKAIKKIDEITCNSTYLGIFQLIIGAGFLYNGIKYQDNYKLQSAIWYLCSGASFANGINNLTKDK